MGRKFPGMMISSSLVIALFGGFAVTACNMVTGADGIVLYEQDDDDNGAVNGATSGGQGGDPVTTGTGAGATNGSTGSGDPVTNSSQQSSSSGGPDPCVYPSGPYGVAQGQTLPPSLSWQVYAPGENQPSTLTSEDMFDCDGAKGIDVIVFDTSQFF